MRLNYQDFSQSTPCNRNKTDCYQPVVQILDAAKEEGSRTKWCAKRGLDGFTITQVVGCCKPLVEAADKVNLGAWQGTAGLASEERMPL